MRLYLIMPPNEFIRTYRSILPQLNSIPAIDCLLLNRSLVCVVVLMHPAMLMTLFAQPAHTGHCSGTECRAVKSIGGLH